MRNIVTLLLLGCLSLPAIGATQIDYVRDIQPIFDKHCADCHGEKVQESRLRFDSPTGVAVGGESGEPLFVSRRSNESYIIKRVTSVDPNEVMPPQGERLTVEQVALLREWIDQGAVMPNVSTSEASIKLNANHWSFRAVKRIVPPNHTHPFASTEIDRFVLTKMNESGLTPSPPADRATLIRRLFLLMLGLPPTPQEVRAFQNDARPDAYSRLVDRVLLSPHYGERWARHWMDVVRYADTNGFETNRERKTAYHYRDYIIDSFNSDKPYDLFIKEQIAGDILGADAATGFLVAGPYDIVKSPDRSLTLMQRQDELADIINATGTAFLGLTTGCARCHNHKFDPISQKDYYAMQAVFAGVGHGERPLRKAREPAADSQLIELKLELERKSGEFDSFRRKAERILASSESQPLRPPVNAKLNHESIAATELDAIRFTIFETSGGSEPCIDELEVFNEDGVNVALSENGGKAICSGTLPGYEIHKLEHINDGKFGNDHSWISNAAGTGWVQIEFPKRVSVKSVHWGRDRNERFTDRIPTRYRIEALAEPGKWVTVACSDGRMPLNGNAGANAFIDLLPEPELSSARKLEAELKEMETRIAELTRLYRGDPMQEREVVTPDALAAFGTLARTHE